MSDKKDIITAAKILMEMANGASSEAEKVDRFENATDLIPIVPKKPRSKKSEAGGSNSMLQRSCIASGFWTLIVHLLAAVRYALITARMNNGDWPYLTIFQIVQLVQSNPGYPRILQIKDSLFYLIRHCLKVLSSRKAPENAFCWPLVAYERTRRCWSWIGPVPFLPNDGAIEGNKLLEWGVPRKMHSKLVSCVSDWCEKSQETLRQIASLPPPPAIMSQPIDMVERLKFVRHLTNLTTITYSSEEVRDYFRKEEELRYSIPDRAFSYTARDGTKSSVVPLINSCGEVVARSRKHSTLKKRRPPHFTIISMVRDAAARLPGRIGTRSDICVLARDSAFVGEQVDEEKLGCVVSGALDRLSWEKDPCVRFINDRYVWVYLHGERGLECFKDNATMSLKKKKKKGKKQMEE